MDIINLKDKNLYYVGGYVRDKLLGRESRDIDLVYEGESLNVNEFGTVRIDNIDIAATRCETYPNPGQLPVITKFGCSLAEDAMRRDFTINALYERTTDGEILDYAGGLEDLKNKTLRVLHDRSFIDDPTRIIRGLKFAVRFGFELDEHTKALQDKYLANVNYDMCYKRVKDELKDTLTSRAAFERFIEQGIYKLVTPEPPHPQPLSHIGESGDLPWIVYAGILGDLSRLELTREEQKVIADYGNPQTDLEIYHTFTPAPREAVLLHGILKDERAACRYLDFLQNIKLEITGDDLKALGIPPSPKYNEIFDRILEKKFQNPSMTKEDELALVSI
jgi:tRNA nucleotidyltransferase/poly(A) polymerase